MFLNNTKSLVWIVFVISILVTACSKENDPDSGAVKINLDKSELTLEIGSENRLVAGFEPSDIQNTAHKWNSENPTIATVDETGLVKGVAAGKTNIIVKSLAYNCSAVCEVNVVEKIIHVTSISLNSSEEKLSIGDTFQLIASVSPSTATDKNVKWSSNKTDIATIDDKGLVKSKGVGDCIITATADGKSAKCNISVSEKSVEFTNISGEAIDASIIKYTADVAPIGVTIDEIGVCWTQGKTPVITDSHIASESKKSINVSIRNLSADQSYYFRAYAKAGNIIFYSSTIEVATKGSIVTNFELKEILYYIRKGYCDMDFSTQKIPGYSYLSICYGVAPNPEITDNITTTRLSDDEKYILSLKNMGFNKTYYCRAYKIIESRPVYYPNELKIITPNSDGVSFKITRTDEQKKLYTLSYSIPDDGTYEVTGYCSVAGCVVNFRKTEDEVDKSLIYIAGGKGTLYIHTYSTAIGLKDYFPHSFYVYLKDIKTGMKYTIKFE